MRLTCCHCGNKADESVEVDGTGRSACSDTCKDYLLGRLTPKGTKHPKGWYCNGHGKNRKAA